MSKIKQDFIRINKVKTPLDEFCFIAEKGKEPIFFLENPEAFNNITYCERFVIGIEVDELIKLGKLRLHSGPPTYYTLFFCLKSQMMDKVLGVFPEKLTKGPRYEPIDQETYEHLMQTQRKLRLTGDKIPTKSTPDPRIDNHIANLKPIPHNFQILQRSKSSPPRYVLIDGHSVIASDLKKSDAIAIAAALIFADLHRDEHTRIINQLKNEGI